MGLETWGTDYTLLLCQKFRATCSLQDRQPQPHVKVLITHSVIANLLSGQVRRHTPEQRVAASTFRRYSFVLWLAIAQADARPVMPVFFRWDSTWRNHEACGRTFGIVQPLGSRQEKIRWAGSSAASRATCPWRRSWRARNMQVTCLRPASLSTRSLDAPCSCRVK